ncbi:hybrid sensor histidine kinase/response regulator [Deltaproteobacteria bacterium TL4]
MENVNVLIVDDKEENLFAMENTLQDLGLHFIKVTSGNEALKWTIREKLAVILLDVQMPEMNGFEVAETLRDSEVTKHIPIIFVTAIYKDQEYLIKGYETGAVDYLFKPINSQLLRSKVQVFADLFRQQQRIEVLHQQMKSFFDIVANDLRIVTGNQWIQAKSLLNELKNSDYALQMESLAERAQRSYKLVYNCIDLLSMENHEILLQKEKTCFSELAEKVIADVQPLAKIKEIDLVYESNGNNDVEMDAKRIAQVLTNLLSNAIKYSYPSGTVKLRSVSKREELLIEVSDTGMGISPDNLKKLFVKHEKFIQPGTQGERGTGLGLTLSQELVRAHNSSLQVESQEGKGSRFFFALSKKQ